MIKPKKGILLVEKQKNIQTKTDMIIGEDGSDKRLITAVIIEGSEKYPKGKIVILGKYSLFLLTYKDIDYYFVQEDDIIGIFN